MVLINVRLKFLGFLLHSVIVLEHSLQLIHLLHATRDFQTCYQLLFQLKILVSLRKQSPRKLMAINSEE